MSDFTITRPTTLMDTGIKTTADSFGPTIPGTQDATVVRPGNQYFEQPDADGEWPEFTREMESKHYTERDNSYATMTTPEAINSGAVNADAHDHSIATENDLAD